MLLDYENQVSKEQAITATAASTDSIDLLAAKDAAKGEIVRPWARVTQAFNNLTSLDITVQGTDDAGANPVTITTKNFLLAALGLNKALPLPVLPAGVSKKHLRFNYTVNGAAPTTGKISAGFAFGQDSVTQNEAINF